MNLQELHHYGIYFDALAEKAAIEWSPLIPILAEFEYQYELEQRYSTKKKYIFK